MARLAEADYRKVLAVLFEAAAAEGPIPFPTPVLDALRRLVPCDVVAYHEGTPGVAAVSFVGEPRGTMTAAVREAEVALRYQDPLLPRRGAQKFSDLLTPREFHRLEFYEEVGRPLGVEDMFRVWLDPEGGSSARIEFDRPRWDFSERDRFALDVLAPHLRQFLRRAAARRGRSARQNQVVERLTRRELEVLELVAEGRTYAEVAARLWVSKETIRKHLENAFDKLEVHTRTEAAMVLFGPGRESRQVLARID
jgi:DNA-binding CsgD family transcriptional regulator